MPSSNHQSSTSRSSRRALSADHHHLHGIRVTRIPHRDFIIIVTNNPDLLEETLQFQPQTGQQGQTTGAGSTRNGTASNNNNREQILNNLLRIDLREATRDYLTRTRRSYPIYYVFNMSDIELPPRS